MCKHQNVTFVETIEAYHQRIFEVDSYYKNNEYGNRIGVGAICNNCGLSKKITHKNKDKLPKWLSTQIDVMKKQGDWFYD